MAKIFDISISNVFDIKKKRLPTITQEIHNIAIFSRKTLDTGNTSDTPSITRGPPRIISSANFLPDAVLAA